MSKFGTIPKNSKFFSRGNGILIATACCMDYSLLENIKLNEKMMKYRNIFLYVYSRGFAYEPAYIGFASIRNEIE